MKRAIASFAAIIAVLLIAGCGGGDSAPAPANVSLVAHDSSATIAWDQDPDVEYWVWVAAVPNVTSDTCAVSLGCVIFRGVSSPFLVTGLINGTTYSAVINGRTGGGPGGPDTPSISFVPRLAGATWSAGAPLGAGNLLGIAFTSATATVGNTFVAVGQGGSIFSSPDALTWTGRTSNVATNLNAVLYAGTVFVAVGDAGTIVTSPDGINWTTRTSGTANNLYGLTMAGTVMVAVGANGTILASSDGTTWAAASSGTTRDLYGIASVVGGLYVAVGAQGTVLTSPDGAAWTVRASPTSLDLRSAVYGLAGVVAVGAAGTIVTSADGTSWTAQTPIGANSLASVTYGSQFIAVGTGGSIYTSLGGITWQAAVSGTTNDLNAVAPTGFAATLVRAAYAAVGAAGTNLTAF